MMCGRGSGGGGTGEGGTGGEVRAESISFISLFSLNLLLTVLFPLLPFVLLYPFPCFLIIPFVYCLSHVLRALSISP